MLRTRKCYRQTDRRTDRRTDRGHFYNPHPALRWGLTSKCSIASNTKVPYQTRQHSHVHVPSGIEIFRPSCITGMDRARIHNKVTFQAHTADYVIYIHVKKTQHY